MTLTDIDKGYLAGLIDGEGYIGLTRFRRKTGVYYFNARINVTLTNKALCEIQSSLQVGTISKKVSKNTKHKDAYAWWIHANDCRKLLPLLVAVLRVKNQQAILLLQYLELSKHKNTHGYMDKVNLIWLALKELNKKGRPVMRSIYPL